MALSMLLFKPPYDFCRKPCEENSREHSRERCRKQRGMIRHFALILILGSFLCVNGNTCVSCLLSTLYHHFHFHLNEETDHAQADCPCCSVPQHRISKPDPDHLYLEAEAHTHSCLTHLAQLTMKDLMTSFEPSGSTMTAPDASVFIGPRFVAEKLGKCFHILESFSTPRLYLQNAQWLI